MDKIVVQKERMTVYRSIRITERLDDCILDCMRSADISFNQAVNLLLQYAVNHAEIVADQDE